MPRALAMLPSASALARRRFAADRQISVSVAGLGHRRDPLADERDALLVHEAFA
jgi:hypothetical protein